MTTRSQQAALLVLYKAFRSLSPETQHTALWDLATDSLDAAALHKLSNELARAADKMENEHG